jgi:hypothetical protein
MSDNMPIFPKRNFPESLFILPLFPLEIGLVHDLISLWLHHTIGTWAESEEVDANKMRNTVFNGYDSLLMASSMLDSIISGELKAQMDTVIDAVVPSHVLDLISEMVQAPWSHAMVCDLYSQVNNGKNLSFEEHTFNELLEGIRTGVASAKPLDAAVHDRLAAAVRSGEIGKAAVISVQSTKEEPSFSFPMGNKKDEYIN